jgi:pentose-5-phosphate-3-epimerase
MLLPSLLEYSIESLQTKLKFFVGRKPLNSISIHLDFVLPQFAKDRKVMTSLGLKSVFFELQKILPNSKLNLTAHLMGTIEDLHESYKFFTDFDCPENWKLTILVPEKYTNSWRKLLNPKGIRVGVWYDLGEWETKNLSRRQTYLLMTVNAGKSGQKLTNEIRKLAEKTAKKYPNSHVIFDGGWEWDYESKRNIDHVSYSSFWKKIIVL